MADESFDVIVIGAGPGGYVAAIRAAQLGKTTAVVESDKAGGRCLNYACIPAKTMLHTAEVLDEARNSADIGVKVQEPNSTGTRSASAGPMSRPACPAASRDSSTRTRSGSSKAKAA